MVTDCAPPCRENRRNINKMFHASKRANLISKYEKYGKLTTEAYCMKCKVRRGMKDEKRVRMKNGRSGISGICTVCGGKMFKMVGAEQKQQARLRFPVSNDLKK